MRRSRCTHALCRLGFRLSPRIRRPCARPAASARPGGARVSVCLGVAAATVFVPCAATVRAHSVIYHLTSSFAPRVSRSPPRFPVLLHPLTFPPRVLALIAMVCICRADAPTTVASASVHVCMCVTLSHRKQRRIGKHLGGLGNIRI